jgi:hypothetical protein
VGISLLQLSVLFEIRLQGSGAMIFAPKLTVQRFEKSLLFRAFFPVNRKEYRSNNSEEKLIGHSDNVAFYWCAVNHYAYQSAAPEG